MGRPRKNKDPIEAPAEFSPSEFDPRQTDIEDALAPKVEIVPSIQVAGHKNAFQSLFAGDPMLLPTLKSVGYARLPGTNTYVAYTLYSKGSLVIKIECEEPNLRAIAEESAKIFFVNNFMSGDDGVSL